jgi:hypothetical protein
MEIDNFFINEFFLLNWCGATLGPHSNMAAWDVDGFSLLIS